jgi:hypothetical protein
MLTLEEVRKYKTYPDLSGVEMDRVLETLEAALLVVEAVEGGNRGDLGWRRRLAESIKPFQKG